MTVNAKRVLEEAASQGYGTEAVKRAIAALVMRSELQECQQRKMLKRVR